jgi:hypothetical protein
VFRLRLAAELTPAATPRSEDFLSVILPGSIMWNYSIVDTMPTCQNCGSFVTTDYVRVFTPNEVDRPRVCPACEDMVRDGADVREARATRSS